jgi:predicted esterase
MLGRCGALAAPARLLVAPEALSRFYLKDGQGPIGASWMTREDRESEIADMLHYLDLLAEKLAEPRSMRRICALGFSQGAAATCRWAALGRTSLQRLVLWGGGVPPDLDLAAAGERLGRARVQLVRGDTDRLYDTELLARDVKRLAEHGIAHQVQRFAGDHRLDGTVLRHLADAPG